MNYHEIEYNGKTLPIKVDYSVLSKVCTKFNYKFQEFAYAVDVPEQLTYLFLQSLIKGHVNAKKTFELESEVEDILSQNYVDFLELFNKDCLDIATKNSERKKLAEEVSKKKKN